ncbi:MAG: hypothetical protein SynsKO_24000 [Synoicihabitans sp.]
MVRSGKTRLQAIRPVTWRVLGFAGSGILAILFGFLFFSAEQSGELVRQYGYYAIAATSLWFAFLIVKEWREIFACWRKMSRSEVRSLVALVVGLSLVAWAVFPFSYKVLFDELVLQATSWNLHRLREVGTMVRGYEVEGVFMPLFVYLDKRPYFYALLVSLIHDLTGFREGNAYFFNAALFPVVMLLFYFLVRRVVSARIAWAGLACFAASPLLAQNANGAGMDLLNLAMVLLTMLLGARYLERPEERRLAVLLVTCVLLAQTRYESLLFVITTGLIVLEGWRRAGRIILPMTAILTPLLLIPSGLHNSYLSGTPALWELKENMDSRFELIHVWPNLGHAFSYFFHFGRGHLTAVWLSICGFLSLIWIVYRLGTQKRNWRQLDPTVTTVGIFAVAILANLALLMAYFWGQLNDPIVSRLIMPFTVLLGFATVLGLRWASVRNRSLVTWVGAGALIVFVGWGLPAAAHHRDINQLATELAWEQRQVARMSDASRLVLTDKTTLGWLMKGQPTLSLTDAEVRAEAIQFHLDHGTFKEVLITQRYRPINAEGVEFEVDPRDVVSDRFVLEPVVERMIGARLVRISRVVEIKPASLPAESSSEKAHSPEHEGGAALGIQG